MIFIIPHPCLSFPMRYANYNVHLFIHLSVFIGPVLCLPVVNSWTHLDRGRSSPRTHPGPSSLRPLAPSQCCVKSVQDEAAESLQTAGGRGRETEGGRVKTLTGMSVHWRLQAVQHWKPDWFGKSCLFQLIDSLFVFCFFVELDAIDLNTNIPCTILTDSLWFPRFLILFPCCTGLHKTWFLKIKNNKQKRKHKFFSFLDVKTWIIQKSIQLVFTMRMC